LSITRQLAKLKWMPARHWFYLRDAMRVKVRVRDPMTGQRYLSVAQSFQAMQRAKELFRKEPETIAWLRRELRPDDVFLDVGANVGTFSIFAAMHITGSGRVYAMEPHLPTAVQLLQNVAANELDERISVLSIAASGTDGFVPFRYKRWREGASGSQLGVEGAPSMRDHVATELKASARIDSLIAQGHMRPPNLIKIDTDGIEMQILSGMENLLRGANRPRSLMVEVRRGGFRAQVAYVDSLGYPLAAKCFTGFTGKQLDLARRGHSEDEMEFNALYELRT
jgi:FkbM family methyltransferase